MIFELFSIVCFIFLKEPKVSLVSCIETSKSTKYSYFGSIDLQVLKAGHAMSIHVKARKLGFRIGVVVTLNYGSLVNTAVADFGNNNLNDRQQVQMAVTGSNGRGKLER